MSHLPRIVYLFYNLIIPYAYVFTRGLLSPCIKEKQKNYFVCFFPELGPNCTRELR